jgi:hypothetical protein
MVHAGRRAGRHDLSSVPGAGGPGGWQDGAVSTRRPGTRRPRLLPGALLASTLVVATAGGVLAVTGGPDAPAADGCSPGTAYVTVRPVYDRSDWRPADSDVPPLAGCLDTSRLTPPAEPPPTNPRG